jgi:N-ethylmaleimide reductase
MSLFEPLRIGPLTLPHRIVMAPLTRRRAGAGKVPTELSALYYEQRASAALIISESIEVDPRSGGDVPTRPGIFNGAQAEGWKRITERVHHAGGRIFAQLSHLGRASHPLLLADGAEPVAPSAIAADGNAFTREGPKPFPVPHALEIEEIPAIVAQFVHAARLALEAGFDGVELHGANGYMLDQFLRDASNRRADRYGGSPENRTRLLLEVTEAVAGVWGPDRVGVRVSPFNNFNGMSDSDPRALFTHVAAALRPFGLAYLHVIEPAGPDLIAPHLRAAFGGPLILAGSYTQSLAEAAIQAGTAELVAFGQAFIANPDLPRRLRSGAPLNSADRSTFYSGGARGYTDYPALLLETA